MVTAEALLPQALPPPLHLIAPATWVHNTAHHNLAHAGPPLASPRAVAVPHAQLANPSKRNCWAVGAISIVVAILVYICLASSGYVTFGNKVRRVMRGRLAPPAPNPRTHPHPPNGTKVL